MKKLIYLVAFLAPLAASSQSVITTIVGNGTAGNSGDGGPATAAQLSGPGGIAFDPAGNMYVSDFYSNVIRKVSTSGIISTYAGNGLSGFSGDGGPATAARFNGPLKMAFDNIGNLYVADHYNNRVRKISTTGVITTVAGTGSLGYSGDGIPATSSSVARPAGVRFSPAGEMYILDYNGSRIRKVSASGIISTVAGNGVPASTGDGGPATAAQVKYPFAMEFDASGNLYIAEPEADKVRMIDAAGIIHPLAGSGVTGLAGDGGPATAAAMDHPAGVTVDLSGNVYITDQYNCRVRKVSSGLISTIVGTTCGYSGDGGSPLAASISGSNEVAFDPAGNMILTDNDNHVIRKITTCSAAITGQPENDTVIAGDTATFSVTAPISGVGYQWQKNSGSGFVNLTDIPPYSGTHTNTLMIYPTSLALDNTIYRCVVSSESSPCVDTSTQALLAVDTAGTTWDRSDHLNSTVVIFPNPANGAFSIFCSRTSACELSLTDAIGKTVFREKYPTVPSQVNIESLPAGIYLVRMSFENETLTTRLQKQ